jgi:dipeptidyl-peptidase-4
MLPTMSFSSPSPTSTATHGADATAESSELSYPRQSARTQRFTRGLPRNIGLAAAGSRVLFVRSESGTDPIGLLWALDLATGREQLLVDPRELLSAGDEELSAAERARRERSREASSGIVGYATDRSGSVAAFALSSRLWVTDTGGGGTRELPATGPVIDPRPDPTGEWAAYAGAGALHVVRIDGTDGRALAEPDGDDVTWGLAEFVAAEEMDRFRGYWWAPDGSALLAARVDESPVQRWHIADPANPASEPAEIAYPAAGTPNATVSLHLLGLDGSRIDVAWDGTEHPYLVAAEWTGHGDPLLLVMSRDQRDARVLAVDPATGTTRVVREVHDDTWVDVVTGTPGWLPDGRLLMTVDRDGARRLAFGDEIVTPPDLQVSHVVAVDDDGVLFGGTDDPTEQHLWRASLDGSVTRLTAPGGHHVGTGAAGTVVVVRRTLEKSGVQVQVLRDGAEVATVASRADVPVLDAAPRLMRVGPRGLCVGVVLPHGHVPGTRLPVLMDPYGGPHAQRVLKTHDRWLEAQWLADQGFAVVVADGRGTGARGPEWDRAVHHELATVTLDDQVEALQAVADEYPDLDTSRVAIRGWSYGGYLSALAVLRRPDVFHAAVAGAPVTDWRLYDTFYTERYLGLPSKNPDVYDRNSLLDDAPKLRRPLLIIHGLADDNVVAAHTLRLSSALLAAGAPHDVLPLSGVTHMTPQEVVTENLLRLQVEWLHRALDR